MPLPHTGTPVLQRKTRSLLLDSTSGWLSRLDGLGVGGTRSQCFAKRLLLRGTTTCGPRADAGMKVSNGQNLRFLCGRERPQSALM